MDWWSSFIKGFEEGKAAGVSNDYVTVIPGSFGGSASYVANEVLLTDADITAAKAKGTDTAIYTISRTSGEGADRSIDKGDYYLSDTERANIEKVAKSFDKTIVILNVGGIVDTKFYDEIEELDGLFLMSQAGMEGGTALAEILTGKLSPSGKLSDTWAENYTDYPASETIGNNDGNSTQEDYTEGVYVGYRYFDSFNVTPAYEFGYGQSYTDFEITPVSVTANENKVTVKVNVKNVGDTYSGKEVVEVYFSAPDGSIEKPYQELAGYAKTDTLAPGESQVVSVSYQTTEMSSYSESKAAYIMEDGEYVIRVGNSSRNTKVGAVLTLNQDVTTEQLSNQLVADKELDEISSAKADSYSYATEEKEVEAATKIALDSSKFVTENNASTIDEDAVTTYLTKDAAEDYKPQTNETVSVVEEVPAGTKLIDVYNGTVSMESFVASLNDTQLANLANGLTGATTSDDDGSWGADANSVNGAAGETTQLYFNTLGIPNTVEADGPAGVRITPEYTVDGTTYYSYCTAFPIGTLLAQTWNEDLLNKVGKAIGEEMKEYGVTLWLAPGMNIHRDPLCGRNFEYYSEDPTLTGSVGTAITLGVQSNPGVGVTIKHYISNNQETSRNQVNTSISERASREIYLKGFEQVIKSAQPMAIMSSYNKVNGTYACENFDLLTSIPRGEWGFDGMIMTDWGAGGRASVSGMMHAGNDLVMPGRTQTRMIAALAGTPSDNLDVNKVLVRGDIQLCVSRVLTMIMRSNQFGKMYSSVNVAAHSSTYDNLVTYTTVAKENVKSAALNKVEADLEQAKQEAEQAKQEALEAQKKAEAAKQEALEAQKKAEAAKQEALEAQKKAEEAKKEAEAAKKEAEAAKKKAEAAKKKAEAAKKKAEAAKRKAQIAAAKATFSPKKVTIKSLKSTSSKKAVVTWKKISSASGYVIQYSTSSKFTTKTTKKVAVKASKTSVTLKNLKKGKKYYVRVRAYKTVNGTKVYTSYSAKKVVKVK